jgi:menaquinone-specific isochorismate synthase
MTVTPFRVPLMQDPKALYECLAAFQASIETGEAIASISLTLPALDPLQALERLGHAQKMHFYWEHPTETIAIAAMQPVVQRSIEGGDRFTQAQTFISEVLQRTVTAGELHLPMAGPHFFCSFTFFDRPYHEPQRFPAAMVFLPQWQVVCVQGQGVLVANLPLTPASNLTQLTDSVLDIWQRLQGHTQGHTQVRTQYHPQFSLPQIQVPIPSLTHQTRFLEAAEATLAQIHKGELTKLVLSETLKVKTTKPLPLAPTLHKLRSRYADCQIFSLRDAQGQGFIGASPERLLQIQDRRLTADALAGSTPRGRTLGEDVVLGDRLLNSTKDIHEHQLVLSFIQQRLQSLGISSRSASPAHLLQLPNIQHLRTLVTADLPNHIGLLNVLAALHPTPAVAGTPQHSVESYLHRYEPFDRHLYAAPIGWVDYRGNGSFTVGIRSALIQGDRLRLYAGAGIVAGSDPRKEWAEVRLKLQTLLQALMNYEA